MREVVILTIHRLGWLARAVVAFALGIVAFFVFVALLAVLTVNPRLLGVVVVAVVFIAAFSSLGSMFSALGWR